MLKHIAFGLIFLCQFAPAHSQKKMTVSTSPGDADIFRIVDGTAVKLATGSTILKLDKDIPVVIEARKDGFVPVRRSYLNKREGSPTDNIELTDRMIALSATPADATIFVNGVEKGRGSYTAIIGKGQSVTVNVKKSGFVQQTMNYFNKERQEAPETSHLFKLEDKVITIRTQPVDAEIFADDVKKGEGSAELIIPKDKCINIRIEKTGYSGREARYCNKENEMIAPLVDEIRLKDRKIQFNVIPEDSKIFVDGKEVGKGSYAVKVQENRCAEVIIMRSSYVSEKFDICNKPDYQQPEPTYSVKLNEDEAYQQSEESSIANKNFMVEVNVATNATESWKRLTSIIQSRFDEIETIDGTTSYLRTSWVGSTFNKSSLYKSIVRTRALLQAVVRNR